MMENLELKDDWHRFLNTILNSIQTEKEDFMIRVANRNCYESLIYRWAIRLFEKGVTSKYAINVIHRARKFVLLNKKDSTIKQIPRATLNKILITLHEHPNYCKLDSKKKFMVHERIIQMFCYNFNIEAIEEMLLQLNHDALVDKKTNKFFWLRQQ